MRVLAITQPEIDSSDDWMTLGKYLNKKGAGGALNTHQQFLSQFMYGTWREYSALAHCAPEALRDVGMYFRYREQPFKDRPLIDDALDLSRSLHLMRASIVLLATITELQAFFHLSDANIDSRIHKIWDDVLVHIEAKELYAGRYKQLMHDKGIRP